MMIVTRLCEYNKNTELYTFKGEFYGMWVMSVKLSLKNEQKEKPQAKTRTYTGVHYRYYILRLAGKFWKRWEYQTTWPASWETCMQVRKQQLELDMKQQTGSK